MYILFQKVLASLDDWYIACIHCAILGLHNPSDDFYTEVILSIQKLLYLGFGPSVLPLEWKEKRRKIQ